MREVWESTGKGVKDMVEVFGGRLEGAIAGGDNGVARVVGFIN